MKAEVLIVGAGPTGLVLACELARRGVPHRLIERSERPAEGSRGKGVQPRSLEVFEDLGIAEELIAGGRFDMPMLLHEADGSRLLDLSAAPRESMPYGSPLITPQWRVEALLRSRLADLGGRVDWGCEVAGVEQAGDQVVARLQVGGHNKSIETKWLVGCDGGQSAVRKCAAVPFVGETFEHIRMWVGDLTLEGLDRDHWHLWRDQEGFLALCPLPGTDQFQFQARIPADERREPSLAAFDEVVRQRAGGIRLLSASWLSSWRANVRMVERFRVGRVLLAGDAAHVHSPAGAQGMNTGMQDAYNLGWKLAAVLAGADEGLVDTYQEERLPVARGVLDLSSELTQSAFSPYLRRDDRTSQLDLNYRGSSLSVDAGPASAVVRTGDRAPNGTGLRGPDGTKRNLFDLLRGTHHTVLIFGSDLPAPLAAALNAFGDAVHNVRIVTADSSAPNCWVDEEGAAQRAYAPVPDALFVIRPDGYVGLTGSTADFVDLNGYLQRVIGARFADALERGTRPLPHMPDLTCQPLRSSAILHAEVAR